MRIAFFNRVFCLHITFGTVSPFLRNQHFVMRLIPKLRCISIEAAGNLCGRNHQEEVIRGAEQGFVLTQRLEINLGVKAETRLFPGDDPDAVGQIKKRPGRGEAGCRACFADLLDFMLCRRHGRSRPQGAFQAVDGIPDPPPV